MLTDSDDYEDYESNSSPGDAMSEGDYAFENQGQSSTRQACPCAELGSFALLVMNFFLLLDYSGLGAWLPARQRSALPGPSMSDDFSWTPR